MANSTFNDLIAKPIDSTPEVQVNISDNVVQVTVEEYSQVFVKVYEPATLVEIATQEFTLVEVGIQGPPGPPGKDGTGGGGTYTPALFIQGVQSSGILSDFVWVVEDKQLASASTDSSEVTITVLAEAASNEIQPVVTINGVQASVQETATLRWFSGTATISLILGHNTITATSASGSTTSVDILRVGGGPSVLGVTIVSPESPRTHYKAGDQISIEITVEEEASHILIDSYGASGNSYLVPATNGSITTNFICSASVGSAPIRVSAKNSFGTYGDKFTSVNVPIDQLAPSISLFIAYPSGQYAVAENQELEISFTGGNYTGLSWIIPQEFSVQTESIYKCISQITGNRTFSVTATKVSNGTTSMSSLGVKIVNQPPTLFIAIDGSPTTLRRATSGTAYTLRIVSDQQLMSLQIAGTSMSPSTDRVTWTGTIRIYDTTPIGNFTLTADATGSAGHTTTQDRTFTVGGFSSRTITWPAFSRVAPLGLAVFDQSKVSVSLGMKVLTRQSDAVDRPNGFFVADANGAYNPNGSYIALSDVAFAASNTTGTLQGTVQEI